MVTSNSNHQSKKDYEIMAQNTKSKPFVYVYASDRNYISFK